MRVRRQRTLMSFQTVTGRWPVVAGLVMTIAGNLGTAPALLATIAAKAVAATCRRPAVRMFQIIIGIALDVCHN